MENEIFRHFRPLELNNRSEVVPSKKGGVSFLCLQREDSTIDFWIYICPLSIGFSAKEAVRKLRTARVKADPWGSFIPTDDPLLVQLVKALGDSEIPAAGVKSIVKIIAENNLRTLELHDKHSTSIKAHPIYAED